MGYNSTLWRCTNMKPILLFLLLTPTLCSAQQTRITTNELSTTTAFNFPATAPVTVSSLTVTGNSSFSSATSTATFSGWLDIVTTGMDKTCTASTTCTETCPTGSAVLNCNGFFGALGQGCYSDTGNMPTTCTCSTTSPTTIIVRGTCARIK